jgi:hypothetical protein
MVMTSVPDPHSIGPWIRVRIANADPDPEGGKSERKKLSLKTRKKYEN